MFWCISTLDVNSLLLPNQNWISDHLPIAGLYNITSSNMVEKKKNNKKVYKQAPDQV